MKILEYLVDIKEDIIKNVKIKFINCIYEEEALIEVVCYFILKLSHSSNPKLTKIAQESLILLADYVN